MARTQQTPKKSTGGVAPRSSWQGSSSSRARRVPAVRSTHRVKQEPALPQVEPATTTIGESDGNSENVSLVPLLGALYSLRSQGLLYLPEWRQPYRLLPLSPCLLRSMHPTCNSPKRFNYIPSSTLDLSFMPCTAEQTFECWPHPILCTSHMCFQAIVNHSVTRDFTMLRACS
jgi:hypothetical protein